MKRFGILLALCAASLTALTAAPPPKPKLVVAIVIDQFRYDYLLRFRKDYNSGLARLLDQGAVYTDAHYMHSYTVTAIGHSTFLTGATPSLSGIIGNEWYDRGTQATVTSVSDPATKLLGSPKAQAGSSPRRLLVTTVGDELKSQGGDSHVIGVSIKDRSAILPAGHMANGAFWYDDPGHAWVSSDYYGEKLPAWVEKLNAEGPEKKFEGQKWVPIDAKPGAEPFCTMGVKSKEGLCSSVENTPWGNEIIETFAEHAVTAERLGRHNSPDILTVSFSANDYVGHAVGPDHPAVRDMAIRTDRLLGKLFDAIERQIGPGNMLAILTADHGVGTVPEVSQSRNLPGGRFNQAPNDVKSILKSVEDALTARYGAGKWIASGTPVNLYLNRDLMAERKLDAAEVERTAAAVIAAAPHVARVYTRHEIAAGEVQRDPIGSAISYQFFGPRSGDVFAIQEPGFLFDAITASHGTPYNYDTHVPVIFMGAGIKPGHYSRRIAPNDIAPTLAAILGVVEPSGSVGHVLTEIVP